MNTLGEYLQEVAHKRREIGVWDCCTFPAGWLMWRGQPDPMADMRGIYGEGDEGIDLVGAFADALDRFEVTDDPQEGDVGVVSVLGHQAGAIFTGRRWALVAERGLAFASLDPECVLKAWSVSRG